MWIALGVVIYLFIGGLIETLIERSDPGAEWDEIIVVTLLWFPVIAVLGFFWLLTLPSRFWSKLLTRGKEKK